MKTNMTIQQKSGLRLKTKVPCTFKDKKKAQDKNACRGRVKDEA